MSKTNNAFISSFFKGILKLWLLNLLCVFLFNLQVEQLHKIFKLCGSPPDEYWKKCKLPLATMFKPQTSYESSLQERCKGFPATAVNLLETLLSIDPYKRGTASSALMSEVNKFLLLSISSSFSNRI